MEHGIACDNDMSCTHSIQNKWSSKTHSMDLVIVWAVLSKIMADMIPWPLNALHYDNYVKQAQTTSKNHVW